MGHGASQFAKECRERQNEQRREHGVEPLKMSKKAGQHAQQWAQHLASNNEFQHSNNKVLHFTGYMHDAGGRIPIIPPPQPALP